MIDGPAQRAQVPLHGGAIGAAQVRVRLEGVGRHQRRDQPRDHQRHEYRHRHREAELDEPLAHQAAHETDRQEHRDDRRRAGHHGEADLVGRVHRRLVAALAHLHVARDVLDLDDRIVDQHAGDQRQRQQRHLVERETEPVHEREGRDRRQRNRHGGDAGRAPVAQEHEYDGHGKDGALDQRLDRAAV